MKAEGMPVVTEFIPEYEADLIPERNEKPQDECGVFGIYAPGQAVISKTIIGLEGVQHRGHSAAGLAYVLESANLVNGTTKKPLIVHKGLGKVRQAIPEVYPPADAPGSFDIATFDKLVGSRVAIGHTRYSTAETDDVDGAGPHNKGDVALSHNGNIDNMNEVALKHNMPDLMIDAVAAKQAGERIPTDTETLTQVVGRKVEELNGDIVSTLQAVLRDVNGAYCLTIIHDNNLIVARDPWGFHPLVIGELNEGDGFVVVSEEVVLAEVGAKHLRDVERGEIVVFNDNGMTSHSIGREEEPQFCAFEGIYTAREDGIVDGIKVRDMRFNLGWYLGIDHPIDADIVVPVPDSGIPAGEGYAAATGLPFARGIEKRHGAPRTFQLRGDKRAEAIEAKYEFKNEILRGKRIVLEDDSMIKGHTMKALVEKAREAGAIEVHVVLSSAEYRKPCHMGMDTHDEWRLIASYMDTAEMAEHINADTVVFNTPERVQQAADEARVRPAIGRKAGQLCTSCVTGEYAFPLPQESVNLGIPRMREDYEQPLAV